MDRCLLTKAGVIIGGITGGPLLGVFTLGILCPFANAKVSPLLTIALAFSSVIP